MDCTPVLWEYNPLCYYIPLVSGVCDTADGHPLRTAGEARREVAAAPPLGAHDGDVGIHARCRHGQRGPAFPTASRIRLHRDWPRHQGTSARETAARRIHHQPADRQERVSVAGRRMVPQGTGSLLHRPYRDILVETPHHGGVPQLYRDGRRHLRSRSRGTTELRLSGQRPDPCQLCPDCRHAAQSTEVQ